MKNDVPKTAAEEMQMMRLAEIGQSRFSFPNRKGAPTQFGNGFTRGFKISVFWANAQRVSKARKLKIGTTEKMSITAGRSSRQRQLGSLSPTTWA